jgi:hypothetical protein
MPFKNVHDPRERVKTSTIDGAHFSMAFMDFELTHNVFESGI